MAKIIHIDMDAFFAAVEQRDFPEYRGKPLVVGGSSRRGVVAAASYEARVFGIHSAMPSVTAKRRCPQLIFARPRFEVYKEVSSTIRDIFRRYTSLVEPLSLDEAFLDVTEPERGPHSATLLAAAIKREIRQETGLTASAGVSFNKFLAKTASGMNKPDGLTVIRPEEAASFLAQLPVDRFHGIGAVTARRMNDVGIYTGADLLALSEQEVVRRFGKMGSYYLRMARGEDDRRVQPHRERKSIGAEQTFENDLEDPEAMLERVIFVAKRVAERMNRVEAAGRTVTLKIKYHDFEIASRSRTVAEPVRTESELVELGAHLLDHPQSPPRPVRLLGLTVSNLTQKDTPPRQLALPFAGWWQSREL